MHDRSAFGAFAHRQPGGGGDGIGERYLGRFEPASVAIGLAAPVEVHTLGESGGSLQLAGSPNVTLDLPPYAVVLLDQSA